MNDTNNSFVVGRSRIVLAAILLTAALTGCRPTSEPENESSPPTRSSAEALVDHVTGRYAVDAGKRTKAEIEAIAEEQNARLQEVLEE